MHGDGAACFVYHYRWHRQQDVDRVAAKLATFRDLCSARATRPVSVVMFTQKIVAHAEDRGLIVHKQHGIPVASLSTLKVWEGNDMDVFWGRKDDDLFASMVAEFQRHAIATLPQPKKRWMDRITSVAAPIFSRRS